MSALDSTSPQHRLHTTGVDHASLLPQYLRNDFPILHQLVNDHPLVFLDSAASTQRPRQVIEALTTLYEHDYANVHRGVYALSERCTEEYEEAREKVRAFIGAEKAHEVIFTSGTTASINLVARAWGDETVNSGDEILVTLMEHHSNLVPWQQLSQRTGAKLSYVPIDDDGQLLLEEFNSLLTDRTKIVAVASVSNVLGTVNPVREIVDRAHAVGAKVLVDAAQSVPHAPTDVQEIGADFLAFSGHKMLGPTGVGVLWGREELLEAMPPFLGGGSMIDEVTTLGFTPRKLPGKFEAGTPPIGPAIGLGAAIDYLNKIGMHRIHHHEQELTRLAYAQLEAIEGLRILGPGPSRRGGLISFVLNGVHPHDLASGLDKEGVAVRASHHCAAPLHDRFSIPASTRASFYLYNTADEIDILARAILKVREVFRPKGRKRRPKEV